MTQIVEVPGHGKVEFPDGMSDEAIAAAIKKNLSVGGQQPRSAVRNFLGLPEPSAETRAAIEKATAGGWGSGWPKFAYDLGGKVAEGATALGLPPEVAGGAGFGTNFLTQALPALFASGRNPDVKPILNEPARWLMQSATKPTIKDLKSGDAAKAIDTLLRENAGPTKGGVEKLKNLVDNLDDEIEKAIANSPATVSKSEVATRLRATFDRFKAQATPAADLESIRKTWREFMEHPDLGERIPVQTAQQVKRGTYRALDDKFGEEGAAATEAQKAIARGLKEEISAAVPGVGGANRRASELINAIEVAERRALMDANKNPFGLAALRLDHPFSAAAFLADRWGGLKAFGARQLYSGSQPGLLAPAGVATGTTGEPYGLLTGGPRRY